MDSSLVERRRDGRVLVITMQRHNKRNAVDRALADDIDAALNELDDSKELWAGVLTGGTSVFSSGSDLTAGGDYNTERGGEYGIIRRVRRKPLIAAVEGPALGGGLEIVLACDLVVASETSTFGLPEVKRGVMATCGALFRAPHAMPLNLAREMALTGDSIDAARAHAAGFVNVLTGPGEALTAAVALARRISVNAPLAVQASLRVMNEFVGRDDDSGWEATERSRATLRESEDWREGIQAFVEKRAPVWTAG